MRNVLLVSHEMTYTGAPRSLLLIADVLQKNDFCVEVWTLVDGLFREEFERKGINVYIADFLNDEDVCKEKLSFFNVVLANTVFCAKFAYFSQDIVKTVLFIREAHNLPVLIKENGLNPTWLVQARNVVCVSEYAKEFIEKNYGIQGITVIHNFVDDEYSVGYFEKNAMVNFVVSGTIEERKGQDVALEAFRMLSEEHRSRAILNIVGASPVWAAAFMNSLRLNEQENVVYHGAIAERAKLMELYHKMDVFMVTSKDESCSLVALEAAMLGKPLIVTENTGAKYMVCSECIVPTSDAKSLCKKMEECICHFDNWKEYGKKNRENYCLFASRESYEGVFLSYLNGLLESQEFEEEIDAKIKVSVVVPIYNVEQYLKQCMESILAQSLKEIEIICVNDGSTDNSLRIIKEYEKNNSRIRVISGKNCGYGYAMNVGIGAARGEFIGIVEPDDYVDSQMFEILYQKAVEVKADIVKTDFFRFSGEGGEQRNIYQSIARVPENYNRVINPKEEKECFRFIMNTWPGIYRREFIERYQIRHNETPGASYQDNGFWFQGFCRAERLYFLNIPLYYNRRDNPNSSVNSKEKIYCANEEYAYIREFLKENPELEREFIFQFSMKKYHTYLFTLDRIGWQHKKEYLNKVAEEFLIARKNNELCKAVFTPQEWTNLQWIINNPEDYFEKVVKKTVEISIVVPVYNAETYICQCLESLERQWFDRYEVICIDDGSTDNSRRIIERFVRRDKRFHLYVQENQGAGAARNRGLELARGEYILFLDSDDYFAPEMLLHAWRKIRETESDVCVMNSWQHDCRTDEIVPCRYALRCEEYPGFRPFRVEQMQNNPFRYFMGWAWDKLYLKSFIDNSGLRFQEQRTSNDMYFTYMSLIKADRITTLDERLIYQRRNVSGSLSKTRERSWECFYYALIAMKQELLDMGIYKQYSKYFKNYAMHSCLWNLKTLTEETAELLRIKISDEWGTTLDITDMVVEDAEFLEEYEEYRLIYEQGSEGLMLVRKKYEEGLEDISQKANVEVQNKEVQTDNEELHYQACVLRIKGRKSYQLARKAFRFLFRIRLKFREKKWYRALVAVIRLPNRIVRGQESIR